MTKYTSLNHLTLMTLISTLKQAETNIELIADEEVIYHKMSILQWQA